MAVNVKRNKELLFSITADNCEWQYFRASGAGGQHRDKTSSACRCTHKESGAVGEARDAREQPVNKRNAFLRMVEKPEFKRWLRLEIARRDLKATSIEAMVEKRLDDALAPDKILTETKDEEDRWVVNKDL